MQDAVARTRGEDSVLQMIDELGDLIEDDLKQAIGVDVAPLTGRGTFFGFDNCDWKPPLMPESWLTLTASVGLISVARLPCGAANNVQRKLRVMVTPPRRLTTNPSTAPTCAWIRLCVPSTAVSVAPMRRPLMEPLAVPVWLIVYPRLAALKAPVLADELKVATVASSLMVVPAVVTV